MIPGTGRYCNTRSAHKRARIALPCAVRLYLETSIVTEPTYATGRSKPDRTRAHPRRARETTQTAFSGAIGYRSNIAHRWETGDCFPTASVFLDACARLKPAHRRAFVRFFQKQPSWLDPGRPFSPDQVAAFLRDLRGKTPIGTLAERTGFTRYQVTRWLSGTTQPKLPEFLCLVEAASCRMLDLLAELCDPAHLPSLAEHWQQLTRAREAAYTTPWSHAVLRALETEGCRRAPAAAGIARLARSLGVPREVVRSGLDALIAGGQVRELDGRYSIERVISVDTGHDAARARGLKFAWTEVALERLRAGAPGSFGYTVFALSRADLARIGELHLEYVRAMQAIIRGSQPNECVALYCSQLLDLSGAPLGAATNTSGQGTQPERG